MTTSATAPATTSKGPGLLATHDAVVAADCGATCTACDAAWTIASQALHVLVPPRDGIEQAQAHARRDCGQVLDAWALETEGVPDERRE